MYMSDRNKCTCIYVCMCFFKLSRLPVYTQCHVYSASLYSLYIIVHLHVHNSILLLSPFLRLSLLSLFPFFSLMLVCYTHFPCTCILLCDIKGAMTRPTHAEVQAGHDFNNRISYFLSTRRAEVWYLSACASTVTLGTCVTPWHGYSSA